MTVTPKKSLDPSSSSSNDTSPRSAGAPMDDVVDGLRLKIHSEDSVSLASSLAEPINLEDSHYARLRGELEYDAQNLEAESWSAAADQNFLKSLSKEAIKRQDVIYELMVTEMHHVRTLKVLLHVYMHELRQSHLFEEARLEGLFTGVDALLTLHQHFLNCLKLRQSQSQEEGGADSYQITQLGDILLAQFSDSLGEGMMELYSVFCSRHNEAVGFYKEQLQNNKKLQILMRKLGQLPLVRRLGIPECFLLVTQRITKYPVLVERIMQNTEAETDEHKSLVQSLALIKETITQVDSQVNDYEKTMRLREIVQRLDPKSQGRLKHGHPFRREDLSSTDNMLLHAGTVTWKSSGKQKEILAVLLSDMILLLQEKDQKLVFAAVDNKPSVISLRGLILREVAHEDKALFLICACTSSLPEMYEIHTSSKDERITWMAFIREAVERFPQEEMHRELMVRLQRCQDALKERDEHIIHSLTEKQQIFAILYEAVMEQETPHNRLLLRGEAADLQQGETLLKGAIDEVENLQSLVFTRFKDSDHPAAEAEGESESEGEGGPTGRAESDEEEEEESHPNTGKSAEEESGSSGGSPNHPRQAPETLLSEGLEQSADDDDTDPLPNCTLTSAHFPEAEVCDRVIKLAQMLHSLQAIIVQQDSQMELQKTFQSRSQQPSRHYSSVLLEQERQRSLEKQKEQLANLHKLQAQHRDEQQRWEKEKERQRLHMEALEAQLQQREDECRAHEEKLAGEKAELERQWGGYQQDLERLRESTRSVERERERLTQETQRLEQQQEKFKIKMMQWTGQANYDDPSHYQSLSTYPSFRGSVVNGGGILTPKPSVLLAPPTDPLEIPPRVPPRRESISPQPTKAELPIHLISTTNQVHKPPVVQQQIPTKLAMLSKGKEKGFKKSSHQRTHSAANIDVSQVLPIRVEKTGGSMRAKRNGSPRRNQQPEPVRSSGNSHGVKTTQSFIAPKKSSHSSSSDAPPPVPPPFPKEVLEKDTEKIIFL